MENLKKAGIKYLLGLLKSWMEETFASIADAVFSVNGNTPDDNGDVSIERVDLAGNLETTFKQNNTGAFIQRTTGGNAALINGQARLVSVLGNIVRTGYVAPIVAMTVSPADEDNPISATIDKEAFIDALEDREEAITLTFNYTSSWSDDPADYGITVTGTPSNGDAISVTYTPEVRGSIETATPGNFVSTGWNLYDSSNEYAKVVKYSETYGYRIAGTYTSLAFSTTPSGEATAISPSNGLFQVPSDGYVIVTGGGDDTQIYPTWSDWENGRSGSYEEYSASVISLSDVVSSYFPYGMCSIGNVYDEINLSNGRAIRRVDRMEYTDANLATAKASGRAFTYDEDYIYIVLPTVITSVITVSGTYVANDHGIEFFTDTLIPAQARTTYSMNLKNKLERDVATISQQTLTADEQAQVRQNIGAAGAAELAQKVSFDDPIFIIRKYSYKVTTAISSGSSKNITAANFGYSDIEGYTPTVVGIASGKSGVCPRNFYLSSTGVNSTDTVIALQNTSGSSASNFTTSITFLFIKKSLIDLPV